MRHRWLVQEQTNSSRHVVAQGGVLGRGPGAASRRVSAPDVFRAAQPVESLYRRQKAGSLGVSDDWPGR